MRQSGQKVNGPYLHRNQWRLIVRAADGSQEAIPFPTEAAARAHKTRLLKEIAGRTVSEAVQEFIVEMRESGLRPGTVKVAEFRLRAFFQLDREVDGRTMPYAETGGRLEDLQPRACEQLYRAMVKTCAVDTHRNALAVAKSLGEWCVKQGWIATNPLAEITGVGQRNRGKKQLRIDEARRLVDVCIHEANQGDEAAVGVLTAFLLGLRASEVTDRVVRDLDDEGRLLWIEFGKTRRSRRTLEVPALLRPYLLALAKGRAADAQLISRTVSQRSGKKRDRYWLAHHVERLCTEAKVPVVCTQSLRGLHASVATDAGATSHVVASALGHSSPAVTHAHYIDGATARRARTRRVVGKVAPEAALQAVKDEPATAITAATRAPRKPARRGSGMAAKPALQAVAAPAPSTTSGTGEPTSAGEIVGNG
ncbi:MAG TPA: site-specific integrase [Kofleriaceae bacterium]